jgi:pimeloyl-ACP methyl ester carboxylesterase
LLSYAAAAIGSNEKPRTVNGKIKDQRSGRDGGLAPERQPDRARINMDSADRTTRTRRTLRLTGIASLLEALNNFGLIHLGFTDRERLGTFPADDGEQIPIKVSGTGRPVVLVHGLGCSHRDWARVARRLSSAHSIFAPDARGHGKSALVAETPITLKRLAGDLRNLLDYFELERAVLVGHSMGALTVMQYLQDFGTARVAAVGLVDQSPRIVTDDDWRLGLFGGCSAAMLTALIEGARDNLAETVLREIEATAGDWLRRWLKADAAIGRWLRSWLGGIEATPLLKLAETLVAADFRALLPTLDVPVLVVLGGRSAHYGGLPLDAYYRSTVTRAQVEIYHRSGHSPHYAEPARFARDLEHFVAAVAKP